ncbi:sterile alpha motif-like domain-containing protein [Carnobacteriaceae bacterium zg-ZUI252]|nr:sterile alpha motif-like domain-containing protein [Carnobacteriaceae bacterium zg-ZUI252]MBS4769922.1 sterile alpha motif-like domain-containing protein [Carnobacteriaceae bacterium zg-ZUI240]QTU83331.1 sterile alpha motif-like domain-containing protein [Carnobacteriaceae bacterium zg-C25]
MTKRGTFYQFVLTFVDPYKLDRKTQFANIVFNDVSFPKYNESHDVIRDYVELTDLYTSFGDVFDELWDIYITR